MVVRVRLFAILRERAGSDSVELELRDGARVAEALGRLSDLTREVPVVMAVNQEYADGGIVLGDEPGLGIRIDEHRRRMPGAGPRCRSSHTSTVRYCTCSTDS